MRALALARTCRSSGLATTPSSPAPSKRVEPLRRDVGVGRRRREVDRRHAPSSSICSSRARRSPNGSSREIVVALGEQVERDERRGDLLGELRDATGGGVDAQREQVEVEAVLGRDDDLAVEHARVGQLREERLDELGEVAQ